MHINEPGINLIPRQITFFSIQSHGQSFFDKQLAPWRIHCKTSNSLKLLCSFYSARICHYTERLPGYMLYYYRPQTRFAKVMCLHLSVSHSVHGGACVARGACVAGGHVWRGVCAWHKGACVAGGMHDWACVAGGHAWQGACMVGRCACHAHPPTLRHTVSQCAGGTYPTGMHSCYTLIFFRVVFLKLRNMCKTVHKSCCDKYQPKIVSVDHHSLIW